MKKYKIQRFRPNKPPTNISRNLSLEDAKAHCNSEDTHKYGKNGNIIFFDGFTAED